MSTSATGTEEPVHDELSEAQSKVLAEMEVSSKSESKKVVQQSSVSHDIKSQDLNLGGLEMIETIPGKKIRDKDIETNDAPKPKQRRARTIPRPSIGEHGPLEQIETNK